MNPSADCHTCPAFGPFCEGASRGRRSAAARSSLARRHRRPGPGRAPGAAARVRAAALLPQLLNGLEVPSVLSREPAIGVGIAKVLTPRGEVSRRAVPRPLRHAQPARPVGHIGEGSLLLCIGNALDGYLERLWPAQRARERLWPRPGAGLRRRHQPQLLHLPGPPPPGAPGQHQAHLADGAAHAGDEQPDPHPPPAVGASPRPGAAAPLRPRAGLPHPDPEPAAGQAPGLGRGGRPACASCASRRRSCACCSPAWPR